MDKSKLRSQTLLTGHLEGISYLLLLLVAMPMKYFFDMPKAVTVAGTLHGILFVALMYYIWRMWDEKLWSFKTSAIAVLLSLIPFGTFFMNRLK